MKKAYIAIFALIMLTSCGKEKDEKANLFNEEQPKININANDVKVNTSKSGASISAGGVQVNSDSGAVSISGAIDKETDETLKEIDKIIEDIGE